MLFVRILIKKMEKMEKMKIKSLRFTVIITLILFVISSVTQLIVTQNPLIMSQGSFTFLVIAFGMVITFGIMRIMWLTLRG